RQPFGIARGSVDLEFADRVESIRRGGMDDHSAQARTDYTTSDRQGGEASSRSNRVLGVCWCPVGITGTCDESLDCFGLAGFTRNRSTAAGELPQPRIGLSYPSSRTPLLPRVIQRRIASGVAMQRPVRSVIGTGSSDRRTRAARAYQISRR